MNGEGGRSPICSVAGAQVLGFGGCISWIQGCPAAGTQTEQQFVRKPRPRLTNRIESNRLKQKGGTCSCISNTSWIHGWCTCSTNAKRAERCQIEAYPIRSDPIQSNPTERGRCTLTSSIHGVPRRGSSSCRGEDAARGEGEPKGHSCRHHQQRAEEIMPCACNKSQIDLALRGSTDGQGESKGEG
jgi:hypothetical protein